MSSRLRTLVLDANGFHWKAVAADTVVQGILGIRDYEAVPQRLRGVKFIRGLRARYDALSYLGDWREAVCASPDLDVNMCNVTNLADYARHLRRIRDYDLIVVLHAAATDSLTFLMKAAPRLRRRRGKLAVFIGNEYDVMAEKHLFLRAAEADYVCSQLPIETARWLYADSAREVLPMAHALNPRKYRPPTETSRPVDVGFVGWIYRYFIGDVERTRIIRAVQENAPRWGLRSEFREGTVPADEWADYLRRCNGTVGAESGTYYLDREGTLLAAAKRYEEEHPDATFEDVHERFFARPEVEVVSGKCVSSRHFEAIGTQTCQILLEGHYNGILQPEEHYISVSKDLADLEDAIERFKDSDYRRALVTRAYEYVLEQHTYAHRVRTLVDALASG